MLDTEVDESDIRALQIGVEDRGRLHALLRLDDGCDLIVVDRELQIVVDGLLPAECHPEWKVFRAYGSRECSDGDRAEHDAGAAPDGCLALAVGIPAETQARSQIYTGV